MHKPSRNLHSFSQDRIAKRKEYFDAMDKDKNGTISFNEWLDYAMEHITKKVAETKE